MSFSWLFFSLVLFADTRSSSSFFLFWLGGSKGPCDPETMLPDLDWLQKRMQSDPPKAVVVVTPNNPTGVIVPREMLLRIQSLCEEAKSWLIVDNTYESFTYASTQTMPSFVSGANVINIFSFSKNYGEPFSLPPLSLCLFFCLSFSCQ